MILKFKKKTGLIDVQCLYILQQKIAYLCDA